MTRYNTLNVKLFNSQYILNNLKSGIKNGTKLTLNISSNVVGGYNDKTNVPHKLLWTNYISLRLLKAFLNSSSANVKFSKTQLSGITLLGGFLILTNKLMILPLVFLVELAKNKSVSKVLLQTKPNLIIPIQEGGRTGKKVPIPVFLL